MLLLVSLTVRTFCLYIGLNLILSKMFKPTYFSTVIKRTKEPARNRHGIQLDLLSQLQKNHAAVAALFPHSVCWWRQQEEQVAAVWNRFYYRQEMFGYQLISHFTQSEMQMDLKQDW